MSNPSIGGRTYLKAFFFYHGSWILVGIVLLLLDLFFPEDMAFRKTWGFLVGMVLVSFLRQTRFLADARYAASEENLAFYFLTPFFTKGSVVFEKSQLGFARSKAPIVAVSQKGKWKRFYVADKKILAGLRATFKPDTIAAS